MNYLSTDAPNCIHMYFLFYPQQNFIYKPVTLFLKGDIVFIRGHLRASLQDNICIIK